MSVKDDIFKTVVAVLLSLLAWIGNGIRTEQIDMACRLRLVELQQVRIMERMGIEPKIPAVGKLQPTSEKEHL